MSKDPSSVELQVSALEARVEELEVLLKNNREAWERQCHRTAELEAALREIDSLPNQSEHWHDADAAVRIARAALDKEKR